MRWEVVLAGVLAKKNIKCEAAGGGFLKNPKYQIWALYCIMDRPILKYLYNFFIKEDYRFHSLNPVFTQLKETYGGSGEYDDFTLFIRDILHYHVVINNIEIEGNYLALGTLGPEINGEREYITIYSPSNKIKARILDNGIDIIEKAIVNESSIQTNMVSRRLGWTAVGFGLLTILFTGLQYYESTKEDPKIKVLESIQSNIRQLQSQIDTVYLISPQAVSIDSTRK